MSLNSSPNIWESKERKTPEKLLFDFDYHQLKAMLVQVSYILNEWYSTVEVKKVSE